MNKIYNKLGLVMLRVHRKEMDEMLAKGEVAGIPNYYCIIDGEVVVWPKEEQEK